ncbi:MAG: 50S ribosomal protein L18 [Candidatus Pacearchaeota archaeon]|nr:50S ribosomal protein L18 [Candidatus Pacearchaeota archaeon]
MGKILKQEQKERRSSRVRSRVQGTHERPRLSVFRSNKHISLQLIDDAVGKTIVSVKDSELGASVRLGQETSRKLGQLIAEKAKKAKIEQAVFDRGPYRYHGNVKAVAEGAREGGLKL